jgi:hypothetical protein
VTAAAEPDEAGEPDGPIRLRVIGAAAAAAAAAAA